MTNKLRKSIFENMQLLSTEELIDIWVENNSEAWTSIAFEIIEEILTSRGKELPKQNMPSETLNDEDDKLSKNDYEEENPPAFYDPQQVLLFTDWANWLAWVSFIIPIIIAIFDAYEILSFSVEWGYLLTQFMYILYAAARGFFYFFILKGLSYGLNILMEFEFNSRAEISSEKLD